MNILRRTTRSVSGVHPPRTAIPFRLRLHLRRLALAAVPLLALGASHETCAQTISGSVTGPGGTTPLPDMKVTAYKLMTEGTETYWDYASSATTDASGAYELLVQSGGASASGYRAFGSESSICRVRFSDPVGVYAAEFYDNVAALSQGTSLMVGSGETVPNINASLAVAAGISGTVTGPGATPLADIWVTAYVWGGGWFEVASCPTDASGAYGITGLLPGAYRVEFKDWSGVYGTEAYDGAANLDDGLDVVVAAGAMVSHIDASLVTGAQISGLITKADGSTPIHGIAAEAFRQEGGVWRSAGSGSSVDGVYAITGLPAGTYRVRFADWNGYYVGEVYDDAADLASGTDIVVAAGATVPGINAALNPMPSIFGKVTGPDGTTLLPGIVVTPYRWDGAAWIEQFWCAAISGTDGTYKLERLNPGTFRIGFHDYLGVYLDEFRSDARSIEAGTDIVVASGVDVTGLTDTLSAASWITGSVYDPDYGGVSGIQVSAYLWSAVSSRWDLAVYVFTDSYGDYGISGLRAGTYRVEFHDWTGTYADQVYAWMPDLASGTDIAVGDGETVSSIDANLELVPTVVIVGLVPNAGGGYDVLFTGTEGSSYTLQEAPSLTNTWNDVEIPKVCLPGTNSILHTSPEPSLFLRLRQLP